MDDALRMVMLYENRHTGWTVTHFLSSHLKTLPKPESLRHLQLSSRFGWSLANLMALLRMTLFTHRDLMPGSTNRSLRYLINRTAPKPSWPSPDLGQHLEART